MKSFVVSCGRFRVDGLRASPKPSVCSSSGGEVAASQWFATRVQKKSEEIRQ
ncbi:hypothetical protein SynBMKMC1_00685 [Synechococcus sp. BMK-MC-1]|nr:hypothetical protein SynBMKMC1_00685 [Synechococcus sp. BMK-MC-1]